MTVFSGWRGKRGRNQTLKKEETMKRLNKLSMPVFQWKASHSVTEEVVVVEDINV